MRRNVSDTERKILAFTQELALTGNSSGNLFCGTEETASKTNVFRFAIQWAHDEGDEFEVTDKETTDGSELEYTSQHRVSVGGCKCREVIPQDPWPVCFG